jgi:hypothetical protein
MYVANRMSSCCDVGRAMAQAVSRLFLTAKGWFYARVSVCGIYGGQSDTGHVYLRVLRFSPVSIIPPWLYTYISSGGWTIDPLVAAVQRHCHTQRERTSCDVHMITSTLMSCDSNVIGYGLVNRSSIPGRGINFVITSTLTLTPTQSPLQLLPDDFFLGIKSSGSDAVHSTFI